MALSWPQCPAMGWVTLRESCILRYNGLIQYKALGLRQRQLVTLHLEVGLGRTVALQLEACLGRKLLRDFIFQMHLEFGAVLWALGGVPFQ